MLEENEKKIKEFENHLLDLERAWNTRDTYLRSVKAYFEMYDELTKENLVEFKSKQIEEHRPTTAALRCVAMNVFCDFVGHPELKIRSVKIYQRLSVENVPTKEEYLYFLDQLESHGNLKMYWMLKFMAGTGVRASELIRMEKSCLETGEMTLWTKGKIRRILIPKKLIEESKEYFDLIDSKYLFPSRYGGMMQAQSLSKMMRKYGERYGLRKEILHPHAFRHLFATLFLEGNGNLTLLSNLMGHESIKTTSVYLQMSTEEQKKQLDDTFSW